MTKRSDKTKKSIHDLLHNEDESQLHLFNVSDIPLKKAIFEYTTDLDVNDEAGQDEQDSSNDKYER